MSGIPVYPSASKDRYCRACGRKLGLVERVDRGYDSTTGEHHRYMVLVCPRIERRRRPFRWFGTEFHDEVRVSA